MVWFVILGSLSLLLMVTGFLVAAGRVRRYRRESVGRRNRAFAKIMETAKRMEQKGKED